MSDKLLQEVERVFANVARLEPKAHKNVLGDKWKFINAIVAFIKDREAKAKQHYEQGRKQGRSEGIQAVVAYLRNEIVTQGKRTAGEPKLKAHLDAVEKVVLQTVINALEEWLNE